MKYHDPMTYAVDPLLTRSRLQTLKALLREPLPRCVPWREWLAALRPVATLRALFMGRAPGAQ